MTEKYGVLLAGGTGSRLKNDIYNKHLANVYDRLMIEYPLDTLGKMGCTDVVIVTNPQSEPALAKLLGDGSERGLNLRYNVQPQPTGAADALRHAKNYVKGNFPVLCGDVYLDPPPEPADTPTLYYHEFEGAQNHSVYDPETNTIVEKPLRDIGKRAIIAYIYDEQVFDFIPSIAPSERGELELVDIHNFYLENGAQVLPHTGFFGDMGTPEGLLRVANHISANRLK